MRRRCLSELSCLSGCTRGECGPVTVLNENGQALLDQQGRIKDDQTKAQGEDVIAGPDLEEVSDFLLQLVALRQRLQRTLVGCASTESHKGWEICT